MARAGGAVNASNATAHVKSMHREFVTQADVPPITAAAAGTKRVRKDEAADAVAPAALVRDALVQFVALGMMPFSIVDNLGFKSFAQMLGIMLLLHFVCARIFFGVRATANANESFHSTASYIANKMRSAMKPETIEQVGGATTSRGGGSLLTSTPPLLSQLALARKLMAAVIKNTAELAALDARMPSDDGILDTDEIDDLLGLGDVQ